MGKSQWGTKYSFIWRDATCKPRPEGERGEDATVQKKGYWTILKKDGWMTGRKLALLHSLDIGARSGKQL